LFNRGETMDLTPLSLRGCGIYWALSDKVPTSPIFAEDKKRINA